MTFWTKQGLRRSQEKGIEVSWKATRLPFEVVRSTFFVQRWGYSSISVGSGQTQESSGNLAGALNWLEIHHFSMDSSARPLKRCAVTNSYYASSAEGAGGNGSKTRASQEESSACHLRVEDGQRRLVNVLARHDEGTYWPNARRDHRLAGMSPLVNEGTGHGDHMCPLMDDNDRRKEENNETLTKGIHNPLYPSGANIYPKHLGRIWVPKPHKSGYAEK